MTGFSFVAAENTSPMVSTSPQEPAGFGLAEGRERQWLRLGSVDAELLVGQELGE